MFLEKGKIIRHFLKLKFVAVIIKVCFYNAGIYNIKTLFITFIAIDIVDNKIIDQMAKYVYIKFNVHGKIKIIAVEMNTLVK